MRGLGLARSSLFFAGVTQSGPGAGAELGLRVVVIRSVDNAFGVAFHRIQFTADTNAPVSLGELAGQDDARSAV